MKEPWTPIATRGNLVLDVLTAKRAFQELILLRSGCDFLLRVLPDGDDEPFDMNAADYSSVSTFIEEMSPREVRILVGEGEDADLVRQRLRASLQ